MSSAVSTEMKPVRLMCSRRAHHTYEVTISREPESHETRYSTDVADVLRRMEERRFRRENSLYFRQENLKSLPPMGTGDAGLVELPRKRYLEEMGDAKTPRDGGPEDYEAGLSRAESLRSLYADACRRRARSTDADEPEGLRRPHENFSTLKAARHKLIEFLQTEEFFDEYSFCTLMVLILAHMFRLSQSVFEMGCTARTILAVFVYVWRFMQIRVDDIMTTPGGSQAACKCCLLCAELVVIFVCIVVFLWAVFIPVCSLMASIVSKIVYLFM